MSGGRFEYKNDYLCDDIYNWSVTPDYGLNSKNVVEYRKRARALNPLEDKVISELVYDVFCLLHSYDWYVSGDTGPDQYQSDVKIFKDKWLKSLAKNKEFLKEHIDEELVDLKKELYRTYGIFEETKDGE